MWNPLNRAPKRSVEQAEKLESMDAETFELLVARARRVAQTVGTEGDKISEADIRQAAYRAALAEERKGHPYTKEELRDEANQEPDMQLTDAFGARIEARPDQSVIIADPRGSVTAAVDRADAFRKIEAERSGDERSTV